jgi:hypothetical protein
MSQFCSCGWGGANFLLAATGTAPAARDRKAAALMSDSCTASAPAARVASPCGAVAAVAALGVAVLAGVTALVLAQQAHAHVVLAIELVLVVSVTMLRVRPWAQAHPWTAVAARLVAAMASRFAPVHLPAWPHAAVPPVIGLLASTEVRCSQVFGLHLLCLAAAG